MNASRQHALAADCVFDGLVVQRNAALVIEGARVVAVLPRTELGATMPVRTMPDGVWLAPGFIDVQVNGGGDVQVNETPTA
jgi:N-acetylglucosamine-6-phosphate deacetylase